MSFADSFKDSVCRIKDSLPKFSSAGTFSAVALMTFSASFGGLAVADSQAVAKAALTPPSAIERSVSSIADVAPDQYHSLVWGANDDNQQADNGSTVASDGQSQAAPAAPAAPAIPAPPNATEAQSKFIMDAAGPAQASQRATGVPASVTIAQAALESDWGKSKLSTQGQNYFGIKASAGSPGPAGVVSMPTKEVLNGNTVTVTADFKAYNNMEESFTDHGNFLKNNSRYASCFQTTDAKEFAKRVQANGYATDPAYASKLISYMDKYNLYAYNVS